MVISALPRETTNVTQVNNYSQAVIFSLGNPQGCMQLIGFNENTSVPYDNCYCYCYKNGNIDGPPACNVTCPAPHSNIYLFPLLVNSLRIPPPGVTPEFLAKIQSRSLLFVLVVLQVSPQDLLCRWLSCQYWSCLFGICSNVDMLFIWRGFFPSFFPDLWKICQF